VPIFEPKSQVYEQKVRKIIAEQAAMQLLGVEIIALTPGHLTLEMPYSRQLTQQNGYIHAGMITTGLDSAAGCAAFSLMEEDDDILTVEFKTSLLAPAAGERFEFQGEVIKPGRTLSFTESRAYAINKGEKKLIAKMTATMMAMRKR
jgi:uncharacterized protein (TIGR00369 family)